MRFHHLSSTLLSLPLVISGMLLGEPASAQSPGQVLPDEPGPGDALEVYYDTAHGEAQLDGTSGVYAVASFMGPGHFRTVSSELGPGKSGLLEARIVVPPGASYAYVRFVSRQAWDRGSDAELMIHDAQGQPLRGARTQRVYLDPEAVNRWVDEELEQFPDAFAAYRTRWFLQSALGKGGDLEENVRAGLESIGDSDTAEALWARSYGHMLLGEEPVARGFVVEALRRHPESIAAGRAYGDYNYQCYSQGLDIAPEVEEALARLLVEHPASWTAAQNVRVVSYGSGLSLEATRAVCEAWSKVAPLDPEPTLVLARKLLAEGDVTDETLALAIRAVNGYVNGDARLSGDTSGALTDMMLPLACRTTSDIARAAGDHATALAYTLLSQRLLDRTDARPHEQEAELWQELGCHPRAIEAWTRARGEGSVRAAKALELLGSDGQISEAADRRPAPDFDIADLDGERARLEDLRGRAVVLNFWGLGCAPCRREIPQLNELVNSYTGKPVEFLAMAGDLRGDVRRYLDEHEFLYRQFAQAGQVSVDFGVGGLPTHVVLDGEGRVMATVVGAGEDQDDVLRVLIDQVLEELP